MPQILRPLSLVSNNTWAASGAGDIVAAVNEVFPADNSLMKTTVGSTCIMNLSTGIVPVSYSNHIIRARLSCQVNNGIDGISFTLKEGSNIIKQALVPAGTGTILTEIYLLESEAKKITNYANLNITCSATQDTPPSLVNLYWLQFSIPDVYRSLFTTYSNYVKTLR